ncbi:RNA polymerase II-associated protein [Lactarius deliciosus]|nr:RNA polymerase II-associated protein [Lactarius deliciosus]
MSSLAGALLDVDMQPAETATEPYVKQDEEMGDLFGEDSNVDYVQHTWGENQQVSAAPSAPESSYSSPVSPPPPDDGLSSPDRKRRQALEYEEDEEPNPIIEHRLEASVSIPNIPLPKSSDGQHWVIRMPNFVKVDSKPFHPDTYVGPEHEDDFAGGTHERDMGIKLRVENYSPLALGQRQRWSGCRSSFSNSPYYMELKYVSDLSVVNPMRMSSGGQDGSMSPPARKRAFGSGSQNSQSQYPRGARAYPSGKAHGLTYLVAQHKRAEILQAEAAITGFLTLRPTDMQSETHRLVVRAVGQKHSKVARLRMAPDRDPEREKQELIRSAAVKKPRTPRGEDGGGGGGARRRRSQSGGRRRSGGDMDIWSDDDEPAYDAYGNDDEDGRSPKKRRAREPEERRGGDYQPDDFVVADSDEDGAGARGSDDGARRKKSAHEDVEEDVLDKLDAQISQQEADRKKRREEDEGPEPPVDGDQAGEAAMDIESEDAEEEEEFRVRRVGGARTRKAVAGFDEEDE